ncbi:unnamed protein product [Coffea canephora]|uniref:Uncharacterized protein n=1 Tax=Coffea canephora TaxID=49390 RepID=A0A068V7J5_COFCA|nr:unnamed protein product [Coffea canephora]
MCLLLRIKSFFLYLVLTRDFSCRCVFCLLLLDNASLLLIRLLCVLVHEPAKISGSLHSLLFRFRCSQVRRHPPLPPKACQTSVLRVLRVSVV